MALLTKGQAVKRNFRNVDVDDIYIYPFILPKTYEKNIML